MRAERARRRRRCRGFTLLEVLIALLLVALALAALVRTAGTEARNLASLQDATLAQWVGANVIAEARLAQGLPPVGRREGRADMGGRSWRWRLEVQATELPQVRRLDVQVFGAEDAGRAADAANADLPAASVTGFAALP